MLLLGVKGLLTKGHTLMKNYIHMPDLNLICYAIFEILSGYESVTTADNAIRDKAST